MNHYRVRFTDHTEIRVVAPDEQHARRYALERRQKVIASVECLIEAPPALRCYEVTEGKEWKD